MPSYFFDTSALVKRYVAERGSVWVNDAISRADTRCYISRIAEAEMSSALVRRLPGDIETLARFDADLIAVYVSLIVTNSLIDQAVLLARTRRLRGCDALQLAAAILAVRRISDLVFVCADNDLLAAARMEGLATENPNDHP
jgi:hypothetical protein